jgi:hypothetical protein
VNGKDAILENPASWGKAEKIVSGIMDDHFRHHEAVLRGLEEPVCGLSLERKITDALRKEGLLHDPGDRGNPEVF